MGGQMVHIKYKERDRWIDIDSSIRSNSDGAVNFIPTTPLLTHFPAIPDPISFFPFFFFFLGKKGEKKESQQRGPCIEKKSLVEKNRSAGPGQLLLYTHAFLFYFCFFSQPSAPPQPLAR